MSIGFMFLFNSVLLGVGLAMDAFSVSLANGLNEPQMGTRRMCGIAGVFAFFQALMPMTGWVCIHTIVSHFQAFEKLIPWIALVLLLYIGGSMLKEGLAGGGAEEERCGGNHCRETGLLWLMARTVQLVGECLYHRLLAEQVSGKNAGSRGIHD